MPQAGTSTRPVSATNPQLEIYSPAARHFHWLTAALVLVQVPLGVYMAYRGNTLDIWDGLTNTLYSSHKLIGITILFVVLARLWYRLSHGAPADEPTLEPWQKLASHANHWALYAMLILVPIGGYLGISYYPALDIFGVKLPGLVSPNEDMAKTVFKMHGLAAFVLVLLFLVHVAAALYHRIVRKDGVLTRMLPGLDDRS
jgi:cytochrome b561